MRERKEGPGEPIKFVSFFSWYPDPSDDIYDGKGFSVLFQPSFNYQFSWKITGTWKVSGRPKWKREVIDKRRMLYVHVQLWHKVYRWYIRLWKVSHEPTSD